ncbi:Pentatricopeptide repeat [Parasponia andersonii]|uniref:Pentatricopeptide repeat n=1 Tax=Parasponia andersonii TaxID=3476 RepID=A0A2P5AM84_PARAD|nr:Pentatricopeptide repeat [Parasponia andersonii]
MLTGYAQSSDVAQARFIFDQLPQRDSISWAAMIAGYAKNGHADEALQLFVEIMEEAYDVFEEIQQKDIVSWNTMIVGYARQMENSSFSQST